MLNPESVLENDAHKLLGDFEIQTDHLIRTKRLMINYKKRQNCQIESFGMLADYPKRAKRRIIT